MNSALSTVIKKLVDSSLRDIKANVASIFALALPAIIVFAGSAVDYTQAVSNKTSLQGALDSAVLLGANQQDATTRVGIASNAFSGANRGIGGQTVTPNFVTNNDGSFSGTANTNSPTIFMGAFGYSSIPISAKSTAKLLSDNSCVLTLGQGAAVSTSSFVLNGAPNMSLTGCSIQSNTSMTCNGHGGGASASLAAGTTSGCSNPVQGAPAVPDIFSSIASNIVAKCTSITAGGTWTPPIQPVGTAFLTLTNGSYTEVHVCGNLTLSGSGNLNTFSGDLAIVVENGSLTLSNDANITSSNTIIIFTGSTAYNHSINFPNGKGHLATLNVSPPTDTANPWHGISIYYDPHLTTNTDSDLGPGGSLVFDGVAYMPYSNITFHGNTSSGAGQCSKLVANTFTSSGSGTLQFAQGNGACHSLGVQQYSRLFLSQ